MEGTLFKSFQGVGGTILKSSILSQRKTVGISKYRRKTMAKAFADYMTNGNLNVTTTSNSTKLTDHLRVWNTVYKYYQGQLNEIKRPSSSKALKSIKKLNDGEYQLKIQCGKYSHGLIEDTDENGNVITYNSGTNLQNKKQSKRISFGLRV